MASNAKMGPPTPNSPREIFTPTSADLLSAVTYYALRVRAQGYAALIPEIRARGAAEMWRLNLGKVAADDNNLKALTYAPGVARFNAWMTATK
jgi:hypothetical protein